MPYTPPWLNVQPSQFADKYSEGVRAGQAAGIARAQIAQRQQQMAAQMAAQQQQMVAQQQQFQMELQAKQAALEKESLFNQQKMEIDKAYKQQVLGMKVQQFQQNQAVMQQKIKQAADQFAARQTMTRELSDRKFDPTQMATVTEVYPESIGWPASPERKEGGIFGIGARTIPATAEIPATPERRVTRRVPISAGVGKRWKYDVESGEFIEAE